MIFLTDGPFSVETLHGLAVKRDEAAEAGQMDLHRLLVAHVVTYTSAFSQHRPTDRAEAFEALRLAIYLATPELDRAQAVVAGQGLVDGEFRPFGLYALRRSMTLLATYSDEIARLVQAALEVITKPRLVG